jgi:uncharacterized protein YcfJ
MRTKNKNISLLATILLTLSASSLVANTVHNSTYVKVKSSEPIYKTVNIRVPYEEIVSDTYTVKVPCGGDDNSYDDRNYLGLDTIIGAGIGIAVGNQIGHGRGRDAAKIFGGLLGANIAHNTRKNRRDVQYCQETRHRDNVVTRYDYVTKEKLQGYKNIFKYKGKTYTKISQSPLRRVKVTTEISF